MSSGTIHVVSDILVQEDKPTISVSRDAYQDKVRLLIGNEVMSVLYLPKEIAAKLGKALIEVAERTDQMPLTKIDWAKDKDPYEMGVRRKLES